MIGAAGNLEWLAFVRVYYSASSVLSVSYLRQFKSMNRELIPDLINFNTLDNSVNVTSPLEWKCSYAREHCLE